MIYAKQVCPEYQESPLFIDGFFPNNIAVCGNRDYNEHLPAVFQNVREVLQNGELSELLESPENLREWYNNATEAINEFLPPEKGRYSTRAIHSLKTLVLQFSTCHSRDENAILCKVLSVVTGQAWEWGIIRGCCQSDWQEIFYPVDEWSKKAIETFESEYFNTGTEWIIHDETTEPESPADISGYSVYCTGWNEDLIKQELANASGEKPENIKMFAFTGWTRTANYKEVI